MLRTQPKMLEDCRSRLSLFTRSKNPLSTTEDAKDCRRRHNLPKISNAVWTPKSQLSREWWHHNHKSLSNRSQIMLCERDFRGYKCGRRAAGTSSSTNFKYHFNSWSQSSIPLNTLTLWLRLRSKYMEQNLISSAFFDSYITLNDRICMFTDYSVCSWWWYCLYH